jgi:hypothetical protein
MASEVSLATKEVSLTTKKKTKTLSVRDAVFDLLRELGIDTIFGNPGSTELAFLTPWPADLHYVLALQEASAVAMADPTHKRRGTPPSSTCIPRRDSEMDSERCSRLFVTSRR